MRPCPLPLSLIALILSACAPAAVRAQLAALPTAAQVYVAPVAAPMALPATPTPGPTATPYLELTRLAVDGTAVALAAVQEQATHQAALNRIAESATAQAASLLAAQDATQGAQAAAAVSLTAQGAQARATATAAEIRAQATRASAYALTAMPAAATRAWWEAEQARAAAEQGRRVNTLLAIAQLGGLVMVVIGLGAGLFALWRRWQAAAIEFDARRASVERVRAETAAQYGRPPAPPPAPPEPSPAEQATAEAARLQAWRAAVLQVAMYAHDAGDDWTYGTLGPAGWGVVSRPAWDAVTGYLSDCGYIVSRPRTPTRWADGCSYDQFRDAVRVAFPRPFPAGPAPIVSAPRTGAQTAQAAQSA